MTDFDNAYIEIHEQGKSALSKTVPWRKMVMLSSGEGIYSILDAKKVTFDKSPNHGCDRTNTFKMFDCYESFLAQELQCQTPWSSTNSSKQFLLNCYQSS